MASRALVQIKNMNNKLFLEYKKLNEAYNQIELERDALREKILEEMKKDEIEKHETDFGSFIMAHRTSWQYTDTVKKLREKVKITEIKEQQNGDAKPSVSDYLLFKEA